MPPTLVPDRARQCRGRRLVLRLQRPAEAAGAFATAEVRLRDGARPLAAVVVGDPPVDGVLLGPPLLVVTDRPDAAEWLARGAAAVWELAGEHVVVHVPGAAAVTADPAVVPGLPVLTIPAADLLR